MKKNPKLSKNPYVSTKGARTNATHLFEYFFAINRIKQTCFGTFWLCGMYFMTKIRTPWLNRVGPFEGGPETEIFGPPWVHHSSCPPPIAILLFQPSNVFKQISPNISLF